MTNEEIREMRLNYLRAGGKTTMCPPKNLASKQLRRGWWKKQKEDA